MGSKRKKTDLKKKDIVLRVKSVNSVSKKDPESFNRKGNNVEKYLANLEKEIGSLGSIVEKEKEFLPEKIEQAIKEIIKEEFKAKRFNAFIAQDLFSAYIEAGGRELLKKTLKQNPRNVMSLLKMIIDIGNSENKTPQNATQVVVNIDMGNDKE